jgi:hypothetical protein
MPHHSLAYAADEAGNLALMKSLVVGHQYSTTVLSASLL